MRLIDHHTLSTGQQEHSITANRGVTASVGLQARLVPIGVADENRVLIAELMVDTRRDIVLVHREGRHR